MRRAVRHLPLEVYYIITDFLGPRDWFYLRLVSRQWNDICSKLIWRTVFIGSAHVYPLNIKSEELGMGFYLKQDGRPKLSYWKVAILASCESFRRALGYTEEIYLLDDDDEPLEMKERIFDTMAALLKRVKKVKATVNGHAEKNCRRGFQRMLNKLKPTAEFYLEVGAAPSSEVYIDIDGLKIRELFLRYGWGIDRGSILPLRRANVPIRYRELSSVSTHLRTLSVEVKPEATKWVFGVPDTIRVLHLCYYMGDEGFDDKLVVPSGVESLHVEEDFRPGERSLFDYLDLGEAAGLKTMSYFGHFIPYQFKRAALQAKHTLQCLGIHQEVLEETEANTFEFMHLALAIPGLQRLAMPIALLGKGPYSYTGKLAELIYLRLNVNTTIREPGYTGKVIAQFLSSCPKLTRLELTVAMIQIPDLDSPASKELQRSWLVVMPSEGENMVYDVNLVKARSMLTLPALCL